MDQVKGLHAFPVWKWFSSKIAPTAMRQIGRPQQFCQAIMSTRGRRVDLFSGRSSENVFELKKKHSALETLFSMPKRRRKANHFPPMLLHFHVGSDWHCVICDFKSRIGKLGFSKVDSCVHPSLRWRRVTGRFVHTLTRLQSSTSH